MRRMRRQILASIDEHNRAILSNAIEARASICAGQNRIAQTGSNETVVISSCDPSMTLSQKFC